MLLFFFKKNLEPTLILGALETVGIFKKSFLPGQALNWGLGPSLRALLRHPFRTAFSALCTHNL